mmetsp:Transcript_46442/g.129234  ORF Transcript_46442/g.129234 Transcript_46442/m.129234 type:complete len:456 (-) Transcript_46442:559-1926(-)
MGAVGSREALGDICGDVFGESGDEARRLMFEGVSTTSGVVGVVTALATISNKSFNSSPSTSEFATVKISDGERCPHANHPKSSSSEGTSEFTIVKASDAECCASSCVMQSPEKETQCSLRGAHVSTSLRPRGRHKAMASHVASATVAVAKSSSTSTSACSRFVASPGLCGTDSLIAHLAAELSSATCLTPAAGASRRKCRTCDRKCGLAHDAGGGWTSATGTSACSRFAANLNACATASLAAHLAEALSSAHSRFAASLNTCAIDILAAHLAKDLSSATCLAPAVGASLRQCRTCDRKRGLADADGGGWTGATGTLLGCVTEGTKASMRSAWLVTNGASTSSSSRPVKSIGFCKASCSDVKGKPTSFCGGAGTAKAASALPVSRSLEGPRGGTPTMFRAKGSPSGDGNGGDRGTSHGTRCSLASQVLTLWQTTDRRALADISDSAVKAVPTCTPL